MTSTPINKVILFAIERESILDREEDLTVWT